MRDSEYQPKKWDPYSVVDPRPPLKESEQEIESYRKFQKNDI